MEKYYSFLRNSFEEFIKIIDKDSLEPQGDFLNYNFEFLKNKKWRIFGELIAYNEIQSLTNLINRWKLSLNSWHAWNKILKKQDEDSAWNLRSEFVDAIAHECLLRPSSIRDAITSVATNAFHQVRLSTEPSYKDFLEGDPRKPGQKPNFLNRPRKEKRLKQLSKVWPGANNLILSLKEIDNSAYRKSTFNYRNLTSHSIGPQLGIGLTRIVNRNVVQAKKVVSIGDGKFSEELIPDQMAVSYGYGGTPPLHIEDARIVNLEQFKIARKCYLIYKNLLDEITAEMTNYS